MLGSQFWYEYYFHLVRYVLCANNVIKKTRPIIFIGHSLGGILILQVGYWSLKNLS